jgi:NADPH-dependent F420 reductase
MRRIAVLGGTGPEGHGLALRLAAAGEAVAIGSRDPARAETTAAAIRAVLPRADVTAGENTAILADASTVVLAVPFDGLASTLERTAPSLGGKLVIDVVVPVAFRAGAFELAPIPGAASTADLVQRAAPTARVASAFQTLSAKSLLDLATPLDADVLVCADDDAARDEVMSLVRRMPNLRPVDGGPLANARYVEAAAVLLLNLNRRHHARTSIRITGL